MGAAGAADARLNEAIEVASRDAVFNDGRTLCLNGQYLYEPVDRGFPWQSFEIVRVASGRWVLDVVAHGASLTPSATRTPFTENEYISAGIPNDGSIETRDFEALKADARSSAIP
jgi:hypothetical protein